MLTTLSILIFNKKNKALQLSCLYLLFMKFGKQIQSSVELGWGPYYMSYKELKKVIKSWSLLGTEKERSELRILFFARVEKELEKVSSFYLTKESDLKARLKSLEDKTKVMMRNSVLQSRNASSSLNQAFEYFHRDLIKLQRYVDVNATGFRKILKKYDKKTKENTKELFLSTQYRIQPFFDAATLTRMSDTVMMSSLEVSNLLSTINQNDMEGMPSYLSWDEDFTNLENLISVNDHVQLKGTLKNLVDTGVLKLTEPLIVSLLNHSFSLSGKCSLECAQVLFSLFADPLLVEGKDEFNGRNAAHEACILASMEYLDLCSRFNVPMDRTDFYGRLPIHYAAQNGFVQGLKWLISQDKNDNHKPSQITHVDHDGLTPLTYAIVNGHVSVVVELLETKTDIKILAADQNCLTLACEHGHFNVIECLLSRQVPIEPDDAGFYPLHISCRKGFLNIIELLLNHRHEIDVLDKYHFWSPIFHAASQGHYECAKLLVDRGCNVRIVDEDGWLPAHHAIYRGHLKVATLLDEEFRECYSSYSLETKCNVKDPYFVRVRVLSPNTDSDHQQENENLPSLDDGNIPELILPPPFISPRIYGHASLADNTFQIRISLGHGKLKKIRAPLEFSDGRDMNSLRLKISVSPSGKNLPHNIVCPFKSGQVYTFTLDRMNPALSVLFDVYSTFGTKILARGSFTFDSSLAIRNDQVYESSTLYDQRLRIVGKIYFQVILVKPFKLRKPLEKDVVKIEPYWKSLKPASPNSTDIVIESSLDRLRLLTIPVNFTHDGIPMVSFPPNVEINNQFVPIHALNYHLIPPPEADLEQSLVKSKNLDELYSVLSGKNRPVRLKLESFLRCLGFKADLNLQINYVSYESDLVRWSFSRNALANIIIESVMHFGGRHTLVFTSFDPDMCSILNTKQPHIPVLFSTFGGKKATCEDKRSSSLQEGVLFCKNSNFLGLVILLDEQVIKQPEITRSLGSSGLLIVQRESS